MDSLGGMRVPIAYVQPALAPDTAPSDRLMLIAFTEKRAATLDASVVHAFLHEYYRALGVSDPEDDPAFSAMALELDALGPELALEPLKAHRNVTPG